MERGSGRWLSPGTNDTAANGQPDDGAGRESDDDDSSIFLLCSPSSYFSHSHPMLMTMSVMENQERVI